MKIRLSDISEYPCSRYYDYITGRYGADGLFDPIEVFKNIPEGAEHHDVMWLMNRCKNARTTEMLEYYSSLGPKCDSVSLLIIRYEFARTPEMLEYFKSLNPTHTKIASLIRDCEYAQTPEMLEYYMSIRPSYGDVSLLMRQCRFARTKEMTDYANKLKYKETESITKRIKRLFNH